MATPLATIEQLSARVNEEITSPEDVALAEILLEMVSDDVRSYGDPWPVPWLAPAIAKTITIRAAARGYLNLAGYNMERGDMLTLQRSDAFADGEVLTSQEIRQLERAGFSGGGLFSAEIIRDAQISDKSVFGESGSGGGGGYDASL